ncbi:MAG: putative protein [Eubacterium sp.]|uniref:alpha/beta hydrolase n=1 Tax=Eubacterium sp. TaxID=142586 RepID=UPI003060E92E
MSHYICRLSDEVERKHIRYNNRYGITLAGDLYTPIDMDKSKKYTAVVVGAPYGGVKEQGPCVYANELAQRGFVVLTFDPCYMGESAGEPRHVSSPDLFSENISAGVDYLGLLPFVDREKIAAIGICGSGGFSLSAAQVDTRIRAVITASMYDMSAASRLGTDKETLQKNKERLSAQRWIDAKNGCPEWIPSFPEEPVDKVPEGLDPVSDEFYRFYGVKRGHHPNAQAGFTTTSDLSFMNYSLLDHVDEISPRPILMIVGDRAASRFFSEQVYERAAEPKELYIVEDAEHIDLYDRTDRIPFDKIESFLRKNLK